jgi:hypothetical protein
MRAQRALRFLKTITQYYAVPEIYLFFYHDGGFKRLKVA